MNRRSTVQRPQAVPALCLAAAGLVALVVGLVLDTDRRSGDRLEEHGVAVDGTVQRTFGVTRGGSFGGYTYAYSWDGQLFSESATDGADGLYPGAPITVLVDPDDPERSVLQSRASDAGQPDTLSFLLLGIGAMLLASGVLAGWRLTRGTEQPPQSPSAHFAMIPVSSAAAVAVALALAGLWSAALVLAAGALIGWLTVRRLA